MAYTAFLASGCGEPRTDAHIRDTAEAAHAAAQATYFQMCRDTDIWADDSEIGEAIQGDLDNGDLQSIAIKVSWG